MSNVRERRKQIEKVQIDRELTVAEIELSGGWKVKG